MAEAAGVRRRRRRLGPLSVDPSARTRLHRRRQPGAVQRQRPRSGQELFTESVVALNMNTGKFRWHYQEVHHDIWDYDTAANALVLFDLKIQGAGAPGDRLDGQDRLGLHPRPHERQAADRDPREGGAAERRAAHVADPADPEGAAVLGAVPALQVAWAKWKAPDGNPVKVGCLYTPYNEKQYTVFAPTALGGVGLAAVELLAADRQPVRLLEGQLESAWKALPKSRVGQAQAARQLLPDRRALRARRAARRRRDAGEGRRDEHAHEPARLDGTVPASATCATAASCRRPAGSCSSAATTGTLQAYDAARQAALDARRSWSRASRRRR